MDYLKLFISLTFIWITTQGKGQAPISSHNDNAFQLKFEYELRQNFEEFGSRGSSPQFPSQSLRFDLWNRWRERKHWTFKIRRRISRAVRPLPMNIDKFPKNSKMLSFLHNTDELSAVLPYGNSKRNNKTNFPSNAYFHNFANEKLLPQRHDPKNNDNTKEIQKVDFQDVFSKNQVRNKYRAGPEARNIQEVLLKNNEDLQADILTQHQNIEQITIKEDGLEKQILKTVGTTKVFTTKKKRSLLRNVHPRLHDVVMKREDKTSHHYVILKNVQKYTRQRRLMTIYANVKTLKTPNLMLFSNGRMPFWLKYINQPVQFGRGIESSIAHQQRRPKSLIRIGAVNLEKASKRFLKNYPRPFIKTTTRRKLQKHIKQLMKGLETQSPGFDDKSLGPFLSKPYRHQLTGPSVPPFRSIFKSSKRNQSSERKFMFTPTRVDHIPFTTQATKHRVLHSKMFHYKQPRGQSMNELLVSKYHRPAFTHRLHFMPHKSMFPRSPSAEDQRPYSNIPDYNTESYFKSNKRSRILAQNHAGGAARGDINLLKTLELKNLAFGERFNHDSGTFKVQRNLDKRNLIPSHRIKPVQKGKRPNPIFRVKQTHASRSSNPQSNLWHENPKETKKSKVFYQHIADLMQTELSSLSPDFKMENDTFSQLANLCTLLHSSKNDTKSESKSPVNVKDMFIISNMVKRSILYLKFKRRVREKVTEKLSLLKKTEHMLVKGADMIWLLICKILCLMKHAAQILFSQIAFFVHSGHYENSTSNAQTINANMIVHLGQQVLFIVTDNFKSLVSNRSQNLETWSILPVLSMHILDKMNTTKNGRFLGLTDFDKRNSSVFNKKQIENRDKRLKTSSFTGLNMSLGYSNLASGYHKLFPRTTDFATFLRYENPDRKRKVTFNLNKPEITSKQSKRRRDNISRKIVLHKTKIRDNFRKIKEKTTAKVLKTFENKYFYSKAYKFSRKEKGIVSIEMMTSAGKKGLISLFNGFSIPRFSVRTKTTEIGIAKRRHRVRPVSRKVNRRRRRVAQLESYNRPDMRPDWSNRHKDHHPRELSSRRAVSQNGDDSMNDPFPYTWKNINELPDGDTQDLQNKLLQLMELARKKDKYNPIKEHDSNQMISKSPTNAHLARHQEKSSIKSITSLTKIKPNYGHGKMRHRKHLRQHPGKHPSLADRQLLRNIELLTFLVLGKENISASALPEKLRIREKKAGLKCGSNNELRSRVHPRRFGKRKWTKGRKNHLLRKRAIKLHDVYDSDDLHSLHNMADLDDDYLNKYVRTEVSHNTFPKRWKSLKTQLSLLDKQMTRTRKKYTSIQKKIKSLLKEGESLAKKVINKMDRSETDEAKARSTLANLENQRQKIESRIRDEEEKRDRVEEQFMRSGITGKVDDIKDELSKEQYQLDGEDSLEHVDFNSPVQKHLGHQIVHHVGSFGKADGRENDKNFLDTSDDMMDIEPRNELKTVQVETEPDETHESERDDELHQVDRMLDKLLENRVKRSSVRSDKYKQRRGATKYRGKTSKIIENSAGDVADKDSIHGNIGAFRKKYEFAVEDRNEEVENKENNGKKETDKNKNPDKDGKQLRYVVDSDNDQDIRKSESERSNRETLKETDKKINTGIMEKEMAKYHLMTEAKEIMSNETSINKWNMNMNESQNDGTDKLKTRDVNVLYGTRQRHIKDLLSQRKTDEKDEILEQDITERIKSLRQAGNYGQSTGKRVKELQEFYNNEQLDHGRTIESVGIKSNRQLDGAQSFKESKETLQPNLEDPINMKKKEKTSSAKEQRYEGHRRKVKESGRKYKDLQTTMEEATKDLNSRFENIKKEREKQWEEKYKERKENEEKEAKILSDLMKDIDNEVSWLKHVEAEEVKRENEFLQEANRDLKKRRKDEMRWQKQLT